MYHVRTAALVQIAEHRDGNDDRSQKHADGFGHAYEMITHDLPWLCLTVSLRMI